MGDASDDLSVFFPGRDVTCKGQTFKVIPLYFGQYPTAIKLVRPLLEILTKSGLLTVVKQGESMNVVVANNWLEAIPLLLEEGGESLMRFVCYCINQPRTWLDDMPGDEGFLLTEAVLKENIDFFVQKILPIMAGMGILKTLPQVGDPQLPGSNDTETPGTKSSE
jgi:hypothetical protein